MSDRIIAIENLSAFAQNFDAYGVTPSVKALLLEDPIAKNKFGKLSDEELPIAIESLIDEIVAADEPSSEVLTLGAIALYAGVVALITALGAWYYRFEIQIKRLMAKIDKYSPIKFTDDEDKVLKNVLPYDEWNQRIDTHMTVLTKLLDVDTIRDEDFIEWALKELKPYVLEVSDDKITEYKLHILRTERAPKIGWTASNVVTGAKTVSKIYPVISKLSETYGRAKKQVKKDVRKVESLRSTDTEGIEFSKRNTRFLKSYYKFMRKDMWEVIGTFDTVLSVYLEKQIQEEIERKKEEKAAKESGGE